MSEREDLVVVHHASSPAEAQVVKNVLEGAGIEVYIPDGNTPLPGLDLTPFDNDTGVVGQEVMVSGQRREEALEVLRKAREAGKMESD